MISLM